MKTPPHVSPCLPPTPPLPLPSRWRAVYPDAFLTAISVTGLTVAGIWLNTRRGE